jgi:hypothetical protein
MKLETSVLGTSNCSSQQNLGHEGGYILVSAQWLTDYGDSDSNSGCEKSPQLHGVE